MTGSVTVVSGVVTGDGLLVWEFDPDEILSGVVTGCDGVLVWDCDEDELVPGVGSFDDTFLSWVS